MKSEFFLRNTNLGGNLHSTVNLGEIAVGDVLGSLVADTKLETSRAPVDELDGTLGLEGGNGSVGIVGHNITTVQQAGGHVLAVAGVALHHLVVGLEAGHGHLLDGVGLVSGLGSRDDWSVGDEREVDTGVRDEVGLELVQIDIEGTVETKRGGDGRNNYIIVSTTAETLSGKFSGSYPTLSNQAVKVLVVGTLQAEVAAADVVDGLVVDHEGAVGVLEGGVGGED